MDDINFLGDCMIKKKTNKEIILEYLEFLKRTKKGIPEGTIRSKWFVLSRLAKFLDKSDKSFMEANEKQMQEYFLTIRALTTYNMAGTTVLKFYRWLDNLDKGMKPKCLKWFTFIGKKQMRKEQDPKMREKKLMTVKEYRKILDVSRDRYGEYEALWEVYWLSGARLDEALSMLIEDVIIDGNRVSIALPRSKTVPRTVPLCEYPQRLIRWLGNHPDRNNPKAPLWINVHYGNGKSLTTHTIQTVFWNMKQQLDIKKTLSVKSFRITRATIMFSARSTDGGLIYSDSQLADFFGWQVEMVPQRRVQYDMTSKEELSKLVFNGITDRPQTYDILKLEKDLMEQTLRAEIETLKKQVQNPVEVEELKHLINNMEEEYKWLQEFKESKEFKAFLIREFSKPI